MVDIAPPEIDVDLLMRRVREDAERFRRGLPLQNGLPMAFATLSNATFNLPRLSETASELALKTRYTLNELLDRHDEDFLRTAYRVLLGRMPDASGLRSFLGGLRAGRLSKIDILGRLRFSQEGRQRKVPVQGLLLPWLAQTAYRLPVLGYILAWLSYLARLPRLVGHWSRFEAFVMFRQQEQTARLNDLLAQLETELRTTRQRLAVCEMRLQQWEQSSRDPRSKDKG